jgi:hypothetical protein
MGSGEYIVLIPNRDLTDYDIEVIMDRDEMTEQEVIDRLCSRGLYQVVNNFSCDTCGKPFKTQKALIKHEMNHIAEETGKEQDNGNSINSL